MSSSSSCSSLTSTSPGLSPSSEDSSTESSQNANFVSQSDTDFSSSSSNSNSNSRPTSDSRPNSDSNSHFPADLSIPLHFPIPPRLLSNASSGTGPRLLNYSRVSRFVENVFHGSASYIMDLLRPFTDNHLRHSSAAGQSFPFPEDLAFRTIRQQSDISMSSNTSASDRPQAIEQNNRLISSDDAWTDFEPLREAQMVLKNLITEISESAGTSPHESDIYYERAEQHVPPGHVTKSESLSKNPHPSLDQLSEFHLQTNASGLFSPSSTQHEIRIRRISQDHAPRLSETDPRIADSPSTESSSKINTVSDLRDIEEFEKKVLRLRHDIQIFAKHIFDECNKNPHKNIERFLDFKHCYEVFKSEEYKNVNETCSAYKEKDREGMLKHKIEQLTKIHNENNFFFARLQYAIFMVKLYMKFDDVKKITMDIRKLEEHVNTLDEWQNNSSREEDSSD